MGKVLFIVVAALCAFVVLCFFGPVESDRPFWRTVRKVRSAIDTASYWIINLLAISMLLLAAYEIVKALLRRGT